jgi:hypothetical protein
MSDFVNRIPNIHSLYCALTGLNLRYTPLEHDSSWFLFLKDFDEADLKSVIQYLQSHYRDKPEILRATLRFRHLIVCKEYFREFLAEARCWKARKNEHTPQQSVLASAGIKPEPKQADARPIGEVVKGLDCLKKLKEEMGWK